MTTARKPFLPALHFWVLFSGYLNFLKTLFIHVCFFVFYQLLLIAVAVFTARRDCNNQAVFHFIFKGTD